KFGTLPKGSWVVSYKVIDKKIWDMIKNKKLRGFSIEVLADLKKLKLKYKNNKNKKDMEKEKNKQKFLDAVTDQGVQVRFDALEVGQLIYAVAEDGTEVLLEQGTYLINYEDRVYEVVVDENGTMTAINQVSENKAESDFASEIKSLQERLEAIEKKLESFTASKPTAQARKQQPLTSDGSSAERVHFSNIKVKF
ncbi:MAG TPA: XkdF-like putative serine protease domain-containing protein, partial [Planctomycetota bacterium]|nr:XkdF-like putative serine protease domain-containing protein [Planctomycetota bacterium]